MKDLKHYLLLVAILAFGFGAFVYFDFNRQAQVGVTIALGAAYVFWGVVHHTIKKDFHWRILVEYLAVAAIATILLISLLFRT